ncbi:DUF4493 domain-containing protein [Parabacteroides sp. PF5-9]|uniref:DUF4493 domain-containing protein n=1 Tax=Parabacteroides sp. PF5-9 TaxID=1742404 RepID=UPI002473A6F0|nr:DUF4493 domain-containing protein [Parabacteroides sp. PF5-9]
MKAIYLILILTGFSLFSCSLGHEDNFSFSGSEMGGLNLQIPTVDDSDPIMITRSADFSILNAADFTIEIYKKGENSYYKRYETYTAMQQEGTPLELPVGDYTIKAFSYEQEPVLRDKPYFLGETDLQIEAHEISRVTVECKYESLGVEIALTDAFRHFFQDSYKITVLQDTGSSAIFTKENPKRIYFTNDCAYLKVIIECTTKENEVYPARTYYFNKEGQDPAFNGDGPFVGEYFIITVDTDKAVAQSR